MDFTLTDDQKQIVDAARKFARNEFPKVARECDREEKFPHDVWTKAGELGFMGIFITPQYGGLGLGYLSMPWSWKSFGEWIQGSGTFC